ncbi:hypothetical protein [Roseococcus sp. YIM B11640]|uniref:hypothetical protein n=1 Tax=Roseococcus sp. YIM B11640 TaxID=3133973 RepID=UPI003C7C4051
MRRSYGSRLGAGLLGAVLAWAVMVAVAAMIDTTFVAILVFWPIYGITFLLAGLVGAFVAAGFARREWHQTLLLAASLTIVLFALVPIWFAWINQGNTRF